MMKVEEGLNESSLLVESWVHEFTRVFGDRLINKDD
jgi:hypothetical protein